MALFERSEYMQRVAKTKARMEKAGIKVLLVTSPANMYYLTGYDGWSFYVHQMVILALDAEEPIWAGRDMDAIGADFTVFLKKENILGYTDGYVASATQHPMQFMADILKEKGWDKRSLGVEMDAYYFTARCYEELRNHLPNASFKDADLLVNWVRMVKSPQELTFMAEAGKIAEKTMQATIDAIEPGVRQCDPMATLYDTQIRGTDDFPGDYTCKPPNAPTGKWAKAPHLAWADDVHRVGEVTNLELGGCRYRYHAPLSRTVYLGTPPDEMQDTAKVVVEGLNAALDAVKPGVACEDVEAAWSKVIAKYGIVKDSRIGYPVGIGYPPTWGELTVSLRPGDKTVIEENMTLHCIPAIWKDDWSIVISESFRVGKNGAETFANFPRQLFHKS